MTVLGVDPGITGAIVLYGDGDTVVFDMPSYKLVVKEPRFKSDGFYKNGKPKTKKVSNGKFKTVMDYKELHRILLDLGKRADKIFVEKQGCIQGGSIGSGGTKQCSTTMYNYGRLMQILEQDFADKLIEERPVVWKKHFELTGKLYKENKKIAVLKANELGFYHKIKRADIYEAWLMTQYVLDKYNRS